MSRKNEFDLEIEEVVRGFKDEMKEGVGQMSSKYNFDFVRLVPTGSSPFKWICKSETINSGSRW